MQEPRAPCDNMTHEPPPYERLPPRLSDGCNTCFTPSGAAPQLCQAYSGTLSESAVVSVYISHEAQGRVALRASWWSAVTIVASFVTALFEPLMIGFKTYPGLYPWNDGAALLEYLLLAVFSVDMAVCFYVPYVDKQRMRLVTDRALIRRRYLQQMFWVDLVGLIPWDFIAMAAAGVEDRDCRLSNLLALLRWLTLVRCYRIWWLFRYHEQYNKVLSQTLVTLLRNATYLFFMLHFAACTFWYLARLEGFSADSWVGQLVAPEGDAPLVQEPMGVQYAFSLYFTVTTFATVGYGDIKPSSCLEVFFVICFIFINVLASAYIIGTMTLVVVRGDERTREYREKMAGVQQYSEHHAVPHTLRESMRQHVELHFQTQEHSDEKVLSSLPSTVRRRLLRHLYLAPLQRCYLFKGVKQKLLEALLAAGRVELYMPHVEVVSEGDHVNDLYILLNGTMEVLLPRPITSINLSAFSATVAALEEGALAAGGGGGGGGGRVSDSANNSLHGAHRKQLLTPGDCFAEVPFFTQTANMEAVRTLDVSRVMLVPRAAYDSIAKEFIMGSQQVLFNLQSHCEDGVLRDGRHLREDTVHAIQSGSFGTRKQAMVDLGRVRTMVASHIQHVNEMHTFEFLSAAAKGDDVTLKRMLDQGHNVNLCDYDHRSALMLACAKGNGSSVHLLLEARPDLQLLDKSGCSALMEACRSGNSALVVDLLRHGAKLGMDSATLAGHLCRAVHECDINLLRRMIQAGADVGACDYDKRTALHIAAADGSLLAVKVLVAEGRAPVLVQDRFGQTPLDEARRTGAQAVADYLDACVSEADRKAALDKFARARTAELLQSCSSGDVARVQGLLERGCPPDASDYDNRTGLMLAVAKGHKAVAQLLLRWGASALLQDNFGSTAKSEAQKYGRRELLELLEASEKLPRGSPLE